MFNQTAENLFSCICPEGYAGLTCETGMCDNYVCINISFSYNYVYLVCASTALT